MAANSGGYAIRITAVDGATRQIEAINKRLASLRAPVDRMQGSLAKLSRLSGLQTVAGGFRSLSTHAVDAARSISSVLPGMSALTGAATIAGMAKLVGSWSDFGVGLLHASQRLGISAERLHGLQGAARLAGADAESLTSGLQSLGDTMQDAVAGRAPEAVRLFNALGVDIRGVGHNAKNAADVLPQVADRIARMRNPVLQARVAADLFGGAAEKLLPFLRRGAAGIEEYRRQAALYGLVNTEGAKQADRMREAQTRVAMAFEGLGNAIAQHVGPVLTPLLNDFSKWIAANREWIATGIGQKVKEFADWLRGIDWAEQWKGAKEFAVQVNDVVDKLGGWKTVSQAIFALWAVNKLSPVIGGLTRFGIALTTVAGGAGTLLTALTALAGPLSLIAAGVAFIQSLKGTTDEQKATMRQNFRERALGAGGGAPVNAHPTGSAADIENSVYDGYLRRGMSPEEAAGLTAQWVRESGSNINNHNAAGGGTGAHGGHQWRGPRAEAFRSRYGYYPSDPRATLEQQQDFAADEYRRGYRGRVEGDVRRGGVTPDAGDYGVSMSQIYEGHGDTNEDAKRGQLALQIARRQAARRLANPAAPAAGGQAAPGVAPAASPQRLSLNGSANVNIAFANAPAGMTARATGDGIFGAPNIRMPMSAAG